MVIFLISASQVARIIGVGVRLMSISLTVPPPPATGAQTNRNPR
jgi:hypothetical protein